MTPRAVGNAQSPLLERERELEVFERALGRLAEGAGSLLLVEGPAGIGKTRLLAEAAELAGARGFHVRTARAGEIEREMPFAPVRQLFEPLLARASEEERATLLAGSAGLALAALGLGADEGMAGLDPFAPIHGLYWLAANLAELEPLILVVDDAHWGDAQTLRWLDYLARRLADIPVLVLVGVRTGEPAPPEELDRIRLEAERIHPSPLSAEAVEMLLAAALRSEPTPEFTAACAEATAGNPFLLAEIVRVLRADSIAPSADAAAAIRALGPESVARYVLMRVARFGADAVSLARAIAILGATSQLGHAARLAGLDEAAAFALCDRLREAEILAPGLPIEFVHPLVRAAIYNEQAKGERSQAHRRAAAVLAEAGIGAREIAPHLIASAPNGDKWVVEQLGAAAWEAIRAGAHGAAEAYLERALAEPPEDEAPLRYALGRCLLQTDPRRAATVLVDVADSTSDAALRMRALRDAAMGYFVATDLPQGERCLEAQLELLPESEREKRLIAEADLYVYRMGASGRALASSDRIRSVARGVAGESPGECLARQALSIDLFMEPGSVDEVVHLASRFPPHPWELRTVVVQAATGILTWSGRWDDARRALIGMSDAARSLGLVINLGYYSGLLAMTSRHAGRLADSEAEARTAREIAEAVAVSSSPWWQATTNLIATLLARGDLAEAGRVADGIELSASVEEIAAAVTPWPLEVGGYLNVARGELEAGVRELLAFGEDAERFRFFNPSVTPWRQEAAPALAALDRTAEATELIKVAEERARRFGAAHVIGGVLRSRGLIEPRARQIETLRESVALLDEYGPPHELARSLLELGAALRREGSRSEAREPLYRALELAHRCRAGGTEERAREELAAAGSRPRKAMRTGVASLTASELRTAKLAAEGLSNVEIAQRLFVSRKTVEKHLGNAYTKLEVAGREELAGALADPS